MCSKICICLLQGAPQSFRVCSAFVLMLQWEGTASKPRISSRWSPPMEQEWSRLIKKLRMESSTSLTESCTPSRQVRDCPADKCCCLFPFKGRIRCWTWVVLWLVVDNLMQILTRDQRYFSTLIDAGKAAGLLDMLEGKFCFCCSPTDGLVLLVLNSANSSNDQPNLSCRKSETSVLVPWQTAGRTPCSPLMTPLLRNCQLELLTPC